jgi:hypothetical protein
MNVVFRMLEIDAASTPMPRARSAATAAAVVPVLDGPTMLAMTARLAVRTEASGNNRLRAWR